MELLDNEEGMGVNDRGRVGMRQVRGKRTAPGLWEAAGVCVMSGSWRCLQPPQEGVERGQETPSPPPPALPQEQH